jgi:TRAP transporter TAXI family solute receptor
MAFLAMTMACGNSAAQAAETEYDPAKVSESLKAIFQFGSVATKQALNANTVTLISGTIGGTYVQFGADLASVLDDGNKLRVLPIVGRGSVQSVADILFLQGVDLGIVRADTLDYLEKKGFAKDIKKQFTYVTKLYNEEMYVIAPKSVTSVSQLNGKKVSVDLPNGGTFVTAAVVFERLGIKPNFVYIEQRIAMEKMRAGEIDAVIAVGGKPYKSVSAFNDNRFHLVPVDYARPLQADYLPATLTSKDYPNLIAEGAKVDTIAVPAVLAAYNWAPNTERYRKLAQSDVPEPALPPEMEGGLAVGAAARLAAPAGRRAMAQDPQRRSRGARQIRRIPETEPRHRGNRQDGLGPGNLVQAIPGLGSRAQRQGAGSFPDALKEARQTSAPFRFTSGAGLLVSIRHIGCVDPALQRGAGGIAMLLRDMACDHADGGRQHGGIVGKAEQRQHVRHEVERQDEIGHGAEQRRLHVTRRLLVERTVIGGEQVFGEGKLRHHLLELDPEAPPHAFAVLRQPVGRFKTHGVIGRSHRSAPRKVRGRSPRLTHEQRIGDVRPAPQDRGETQATPNCLAIAFIALARSISRPVTPPASCVASTTSTVL